MSLSFDDLLAERNIYRNLVAFARAMDDRDWQAFSDITVPDLTADLGRGELKGRETIVAFIRSFLENCGTTQHLLGNVIIDVDGDRAHSSADVCDMHLGIGARSGETFHTLGRYEDTWMKDGDRWRMVRRVKKNRGLVGSIEVFDK